VTVLALTDCFAYVHGYDLTGDSNDAKAVFDVETLDGTTWGSAGWKTPVGGLKGTSFTIDGFVSNSANDPDAQLFPELGTADRVHTIGIAATETTPAYFWQGGKFNLALFDKVGQLAPFSASSMGTNGVGAVRGQLAKKKGNVSATGALGSGCNLGAVASGQYLYASFHVFSAGTTITAVVESDTSNAFAAPTTRMTFGPITTTGGVWGTRLAGPLTDTWYRLKVTAITGTFSVAGAIGIR
jgi:hypothetical protein